jgi:deazaflavin-dependent oxidoreductase (nitroreductase family)
MARLNRVVFNNFVGPVLTRFPGFAMVHHIGRRSGREFRTPVKFFRHAGDYVITLPYGSRADWVRNVLAAEGCEMVIRGRRVPLVKPTLFMDDGSVHIPRVLRMVLSFMKIKEFIALTPDTSD